MEGMGLNFVFIVFLNSRGEKIDEKVCYILKVNKYHLCGKLIFGLHNILNDFDKIEKKYSKNNNSGFGIL